VSDTSRVGILIAEAIRAVRVGFGWSQRELASRLGTNQSAIARLENPRAPALDVVLASRAIELLGIRPAWDMQLPGLRDRRDQRDLVHARCCGYLGRRLGDLGWDVRHEVEVGTGRARGWIDLLAYRSLDRAIYCPEVKSELHDVGAVQRTLTWYEREAWDAARRFGWQPKRMSSGLVVLATEDVDVAIARNAEILRQAFAARSAATLAWLRDPAETLPPRSLALIDPRSRRRDFLRPTRLEGRRSPPPYRGYAHAAAMLGGRTIRDEN
jgi:transcriptional regulator with XRE-family HTH domain